MRYNKNTTLTVLITSDADSTKYAAIANTVRDTLSSEYNPEDIDVRVYCGRNGILVTGDNICRDYTVEHALARALDYPCRWPDVDRDVPYCALYEDNAGLLYVLIPAYGVLFSLDYDLESASPEKLWHYWSCYHIDKIVHDGWLPHTVEVDKKGFLADEDWRHISAIAVVDKNGIWLASPDNCGNNGRRALYPDLM